MRTRLAIGPDDRVALPRHVADLLGLLDGDPVELKAVPGAFAVLQGAGQDAPAPYLAGSLASLSAPEVFHFLATSLKTGTLLLSFGGGRDGPLPDAPEGLRRKTVSFKEGQVTFASSSERADRLSPVLWRTGLVPAEELSRCGRLVQAGRPLGQVLVEEGLLDPGQLYAAMGLQVREIVLGAFLEDEGEFVFVEGRSDDRNAVRLRERTHELLLEGMRRRAEVDRLSASLPDRDAVARRRPGAEGEPSPAREAAPRGHRRRAHGASRARRVLARTPRGHRGSRGAGPGWVHRGRGAPRRAARAGAPAPPIPAGGPFEAYARIIRHVYEELSRVQADAGRRLESFFERLPPERRAVFEGVRIDADGDIDVAPAHPERRARGRRARVRRRGPGRSTRWSPS